MKNIKVYNFESIRGNKIPNQFLIKVTNDEGQMENIFQSYETIIAKYNVTTGKLVLDKRYWDYSRTTLKYLKMFLEENTYIDYDTKAKFEKLMQSSDDITLENLN